MLDSILSPRPCRKITVTLALVAALVLPNLHPAPVNACACGCGVFEVGNAAMFPTRPGGTFSLEYDFMNQDQNWSGAASAPAADNEDKRIRTSFVTASARYMFSRSWGIGVEVPWWNRQFRTTTDDETVADFTHGAPGDARVHATFNGFSPDLSTGITGGLKLPTGDHRYANFDRDTQIGTGSTDLLLGAYHIAALTAGGAWTWFVDAQWEQPITSSGGYRPGSEANVTAAVSYAGLRSGNRVVAPMLALVSSSRSRDAGADSNPADSGYQRVLLAPGLDLSAAGVRATATVDIPLFEHVNGNQLVAPALFKLVVGHAF